MRVTEKFAIEKVIVKRHVTSHLNSCISHSHDLKYRASVFKNVDCQQLKPKRKSVFLLLKLISNG